MSQVVLVILDGFGVSAPSQGNAVYQAKKNTLDELEKWYPKTILSASGINVGLAWDQEGNSEAGHLTIGAGRVMYNYLPRIVFAIKDGSFFKNKAFLNAIEHVRQYKSRLHLMGLVSSGTVHSYIDHLYALFDLVEKEKVSEVYLHIFTDGRDAPPQEAGNFIFQLKEKLKKYPMIKIATMIGRDFAMDRNFNWDRTEKTYRCLVKGEGIKISDEIQYLADSYKKGLSDESIEPAVVNSNGLIEHNDAVIFFNFREDSARQLTEAFLLPSFSKVKTEILKNLFFVTMTKYEDYSSAVVAFQPEKPGLTLASVLSKLNKTQLHIAETEKYAHVTYFFNGLEELPFLNEQRIIVQSLGEGALLITEHLVKAIKNDKYDFIVVNYANADIAGHTGDLDATIKAIEIIDENLKKVVEASLETDTVLIITADHGNAEEKISPFGEIKTKHSLNPVPFYLVAKKYKNKKENPIYLYNYKKEGGFLYDIAPTILEILGTPKPVEMIGNSLLKTLIK